VSGASGARGGSDTLTRLPSAAVQDAWLASLLSHPFELNAGNVQEPFVNEELMA